MFQKIAIKEFCMKNNVKLSGKKLFRTALSRLAALMVVIGFSFTACAWSTGGPVDEAGGERDSRLVNGSNDAWVDNYPTGQRDGFIFKADGVVRIINDYSSYGGTWSISRSGTWSTSGNNSITIRVGTVLTRPYTVSGSSFSLDGAVYTKTSATVSGRSAAGHAQ
jgi:hypothetical protein